LTNFKKLKALLIGFLALAFAFSALAIAAALLVVHTVLQH
jgi:hypothetical protein